MLIYLLFSELNPLMEHGGWGKEEQRILPKPIQTDVFFPISFFHEKVTLQKGILN